MYKIKIRKNTRDKREEREREREREKDEEQGDSRRDERDGRAQASRLKKTEDFKTTDYRLKTED